MQVVLTTRTTGQSIAPTCTVAEGWRFSPTTTISVGAPGSPIGGLTPITFSGGSVTVKPPVRSPQRIGAPGLHGGLQTRTVYARGSRPVGTSAVIREVDTNVSLRQSVATPVSGFTR